MAQQEPEVPPPIPATAVIPGDLPEEEAPPLNVPGGMVEETEPHPISSEEAIA